MKYPFLESYLINAPYSKEIEDALLRVARSGRYVGGPEVEAFEKELAEFTGTEFAVGVSNGLDALRLIFMAYIELGKLRPGDEVIVPANTYIASVLAITSAGLVPVPVEPDRRTLNMDTSLVEKAITPRTRAILTVHLYGRPCWDEVLAEVASKYNLIVVEDNAQAIGAQASFPGLNGGSMTGALGHAAAFSFYPTKNLGAMGDAGAVTTSDAALAKAVRALANYGSDRRYHNIYKGYNCRLDPVQAAVLRVKLPHIDKVSKRRREIASLYNKLIVNELVAKPLIDNPDGAVWHQYVVLVEDRDSFRNYLTDNGVGSDVHYAVPPHRQPCYPEISDLSLPVTDYLAERVVSLPVAEYLTDDMVTEIAHIINGYSK